MKSEYQVTIDQEKYIVLINDDRTVVVNNVRYETVTSRLGPQSYLLFLNAHVFRVEFAKKEGSRDHNAGHSLSARVNGIPYTMIVDDARSLLMKSLSHSSLVREQNAIVYSPMPGLITKVEVRVGDDVIPGQGLVVLEAMKMENELRATGHGTVVAIHAEPRAAVEKGARLVTIRYR